MSIESDIRLYLAAANTPAGDWIYYNTAPPDAPNQFITISKLQDDPQYTTDPGPGHRSYAMLEIDCSSKGSDIFAQYTNVDILVESVKTAINAIGAPDTNNRPTFPTTVGNTLIYFRSIDTRPDAEKTDGESAPAYQYQKGAGSGIQRKRIPVIFHYWNPNS